MILSKVILAGAVMAAAVLPFTVSKDTTRLPKVVPGKYYKPRPGRYLAKNEVIKVALIDSGVNLAVMAQSGVPICAGGHYNAVLNKVEAMPSGGDLIGHGTSMAQAINSRAKKANYCIVVITIFSPFMDENEDQMYIVERALAHAKKLRVNVINMSFRGPTFSHKEYQLLKELSEQRTIMFAAAGNESQDLNKVCIAYPACYRGIPNLFVVGAKDHDELPSKYTNYGAIINIWEYGSFNGGQGTSVATAFATGSLVTFWNDKLTPKPHN